MTDLQLTLWKRRLSNLCVAAGPVLVALTAISSALPPWARAALTAAGVAVAWTAKNWQSSLDLAAPAKQ